MRSKVTILRQFEPFSDDEDDTACWRSLVLELLADIRDEQVSMIKILSVIVDQLWPPKEDKDE